MYEGVFFDWIINSLYPRSKFEFEQDLPSLCRPARYQRVPDPVVQYVALTRLAYDRGQFLGIIPWEG